MNNELNKDGCIRASNYLCKKIIKNLQSILIYGSQCEIEQNKIKKLIFHYEQGLS